MLTRGYQLSNWRMSAIIPAAVLKAELLINTPMRWPPPRVPPLPLLPDWWWRAASWSVQMRRTHTHMSVKFSTTTTLRHLIVFECWMSADTQRHKGQSSWKTRHDCGVWTIPNLFWGRRYRFSVSLTLWWVELPGDTQQPYLHCQNQGSIVEHAKSVKSNLCLQKSPAVSFCWGRKQSRGSLFAELCWLSPLL